MTVKGDKPGNIEQPKGREKAAQQADYAERISKSELDGVLKKLTGQKKPRSLAEKFRDAKWIGGADKNDPGDVLVRSADIDAARKKFGIPGPRKPGNAYGGWKDKHGNPVDFYRGDADREQPAGGSKIRGNMPLGKLLDTLADDKTWQKDAKRKEPAKAKPEFFKMLAQLSRHADSAAAQFERLKTTGKDVDIALTLSVMGREGRNGITDKPKLIDSYGHFGMDFLYADQFAMKKEGYLPADFPELPKGDGGPWPAKWEGKVYNEKGQRNASVKELVVRITGTGKSLAESFDIIENVKLPKTKVGAKLGPEGRRRFVDEYRSTTTEGDVTRWRQTLERGLRKEPGLTEGDRWRALLPLESKYIVQPAKVPGDRMVEVTGAKMARCRDEFRDAAATAGFSKEDIGGLSKDVERAWTALNFIAPGYAKDLCRQIKNNKSDLKSLNDILTVGTKSDYIKGARVRAAEAYLIEKTVLKEPGE